MRIDNYIGQTVMGHQRLRKDYKAKMNDIESIKKELLQYGLYLEDYKSSTNIISHDADG